MLPCKPCVAKLICCMKIKIKIILLLLLICSVCLGAFTACGQKEDIYYSSADELSDKRISIWLGFTYETFIKDYFPKAEFFYFGDINLMCEALKTNKIDAFAYEESFQKFADKEDLGLSRLRDLDYPTEYGFIFSDTEKGHRLCNEMNDFLASAKESGLLASLQDEWVFSGETKALPKINTWDTSNGEIVLSTPASQVPFHYLYEDELSGYEAALLSEFCKAYQYRLVVNIAQWDAMLGDVQSGKADIGAACIENSDIHKEAFLMCDSTFDGNFVLYVKTNPANEPKYTIDELEGKIGASIVGTIDEDVINARFDNCNVESYQSINEVIYAITIGKADFGVSSIEVIEDAMQKTEGLTYIDEPAFIQQIGAIFNKTDERSQKLLKQFNIYLDEIRNNGQLAALSSKWRRSPVDAPCMKKELSGEIIKIAINPTEIPFTFVRDGEYVGLEIEIIEGFCEKYNYCPEYYATNFSGLIASVASSKTDFAVANVCITEERQDAVDFSDSYNEVPLYFILQSKGRNTASFTEKIKTSFSRTFIEEDRYKLFIQGILTTLEITIASALIGTAIGFVIYLLCRKGNKILSAVFDAFARLMVGLPMTVVLMILYYLIFGTSELSGTLIAIVGFSISIALAVYSDLKVAVRSIDYGQTEGAYAIGLTDAQTFFKIILPQALQVFMPSYKGNIIGLINGTAVVGFIAVQDLTRMSDLVRARTYEAFFPLIATALVYFVLGAILTAIVRRIQFNFEPEKRSREKILKKFGK